MGDGCKSIDFGGDGNERRSSRSVAQKTVSRPVKAHNSNIYGKLGVRSRTQAVARARELNLL